MFSNAKKRLLPSLSLTHALEFPTEGSVPVTIIRHGKPSLTYHTLPKSQSSGEIRQKPKWVADTYGLFPVVLGGGGVPWAEANVWIVDMLQSKFRPEMLTFATLAGDLAAYRRYIEDEAIDWLEFGPHRLRRPTYRYNGMLSMAVESGEIAPSTAKRKMATIIRFYRWLVEEGLFKPSYPAWRESDRYIHTTNDYGARNTIKVQTTDLSIRIPQANDPWEDRICDDGLLRPLPQQEQSSLLDALAAAKNTEMSLIHLIALCTGARIQTVLTFRVRHVTKSPNQIAGNRVILKAGPGTGIDTKRYKRGTLHIPKWLYERLYIYAHSERARRRRLKAIGGDHIDQLLFLSIRGNAFYEPREQRYLGKVVSHAKTGQAIRQFAKEELLPRMRIQLNNPTYSFRFHDLRATFGMNYIDAQLPLIDAGKISYTEVFNVLRDLMWHTSTTTTENYLKYRQKFTMLEAAEKGWHEHLSRLSSTVLDKSMQ